MGTGRTLSKVILAELALLGLPAASMPALAGTLTVTSPVRCPVPLAVTTTEYLEASETLGVKLVMVQPETTRLAGVKPVTAELKTISKVIFSRLVGSVYPGVRVTVGAVKSASTEVMKVLGKVLPTLSATPVR